MPLLNRPLSPAEIKAFLATPLADHIKKVLPDETYDTVEYEAARNHLGTTTASWFFVRTTSSPSDCTMMMPGSFRRRW